MRNCPRSFGTRDMVGSRRIQEDNIVYDSFLYSGASQKKDKTYFWIEN